MFKTQDISKYTNHLNSYIPTNIITRKNSFPMNLIQGKVTITYNYYYNKISGIEVVEFSVIDSENYEIKDLLPIDVLGKIADKCNLDLNTNLLN